MYTGTESEWEKECDKKQLRSCRGRVEDLGKEERCVQTVGVRTVKSGPSDVREKENRRVVKSCRDQ